MNMTNCMRLYKKNGHVSLVVLRGECASKDLSSMRMDADVLRETTLFLLGPVRPNRVNK